MRGDICDRPLLDRLLAEHRPRAIVHFAAESHVDRSIHGPADVHPHQRRGHVHAARGGARVLVDAAGARQGGVPLPPRLDRRGLRLARPRRPALQRDRHLRAEQPVLGEQGGERPPRPRLAPHLRPAGADDQLLNNYGPFHFPEKLIPLMIVNALAGKPLPVYGDGQQVRDWLYVEDHCAAIRDVLARGRVGETYNVGGWNEKPNLEIVHAVCALLDELRAHRRRPVRAPHHLRHGPPRPRPPLRDRREQDRARARLAAGRDLRDRAAQDRALVPRQRRLGRAGADRRLPRVAVGELRAAPAVKILLLGKDGQVGWELQRVARAARRRRRARLDAIARPDGDFRDPDALAATGARRRAAADRQRRRLHRGRQAEAEPELVALVNATAVGVLARAAAARDAWLVHYSTDYVFDGSGSAPWTRAGPTPRRSASMAAASSKARSSSARAAAAT